MTDQVTTEKEVPSEEVPPLRLRDRLLASFFPLLTAWTYWEVQYGRYESILGMGGKELAVLFQVEFIVIHSFPFFFMLSFFGRRTRMDKFGTGLIFWALSALYLLLAVTMAGMQGIFFFMVATTATYLGFWFHRDSPMVLFRLGLQWVACFCVFVTVATKLGLPSVVNNWAASAPLYKAGFIYFLVLGLIELSGVFSMPFWAKVFQKFKTQPGTIGPEP